MTWRPLGDKDYYDWHPNYKSQDESFLYPHVQVKQVLKHVEDSRVIAVGINDGRCCSMCAGFNRNILQRMTSLPMQKGKKKNEFELFVGCLTAVRKPVVPRKSILGDQTNRNSGLMGTSGRGSSARGVDS